MSRLFYKIFAIFCLVIICAISVASFSFWVVQNTVNEVKFKQQRNFEATLLRGSLVAFHQRGETGVRDMLEEWQHLPAAHNLMVIRGDDKQDIFARTVDEPVIKLAHQYAEQNPQAELVQLAYDRFGQEYLFFIRDWQALAPPTHIRPPLIPGLPIAPIWHELIVLTLIVLAGLASAYILASYIAKPIRILQRGFRQLADGALDTRITAEMGRRKDELYGLAGDFDNMAEQLQKLVEKERHLLHHVSHEMRSPLARMQAILGLAQQQPQKQEQHLRRLENELSRMDALVGELLTLARLESGNTPIAYEDLNFNPFIQQLVQDSGSVAQQKNQTLQLNLCPNICTVSANESYLYRAFDNVIRNAMAYSPPGSIIHIESRCDKQKLYLDVRDNGPGVAAEQLPHIFTAFYRADSSGSQPGTGLGLALAKHIIEQHHGQISAHNVPPHGLNIHFELPLTCKPTQPKPSKAEKDKAKEAKKTA